MAHVFVTGGSGVVGSDLVTKLIERGDDVVALARSEQAGAVLAAKGAAVHHGDILDEDALAAGMRGCDLAFHVAGINQFCVTDPEPMMTANIQGAVTAVRAAKRADVQRLVYTSSASAIGEAAGVVANEFTPHRGWYMSHYEKSKALGERATFATAEQIGQDVVAVNPSSVQGPGRAGGTGKFLLAFLDGKLKVFVDTWVSMVDIQDCTSGHLLAAEHGVSGERYLLNGIRLSIMDALALAADVAGVRRHPKLAPRVLATAGGAAVEFAFKARGKHPPVCREMVKTLLHGHRFDGSRAERELHLSYTSPRDTIARTVAWARAEGLLTNGPS